MHYILKSILLKHIKTIACEYECYFSKDNDIFYPLINIPIPIILLAPTRGVYILQYKNWDYNKLKNLQAIKKSNQKLSQNTLAFELMHHYIEEKFEKIANIDKIDIFHFAVMPNLLEDDYNKLDSTFHQLMPKQYILFKNSTRNDIQNKLFTMHSKQNNILTKTLMVSTLYLQKAIIIDNKPKLLSKEQLDIINIDMQTKEYVACKDYSGKSSIIILKALYEYLKNTALKILIIAPTSLCVQLLQKKLLEVVEYHLLSIDFSKIKVIQSKDFKNQKADIVFIDDNNYCGQLDTIKNSKVLIFEYFNKKHTYKHGLTKNYTDTAKKIIIQADIFLELFLKIQELLKNGNQPKDILIITTSDKMCKKVMEDLIDFKEGLSPILLDKNSSLTSYMQNNMIVANYNVLHGISRKYAIILNPINIQNNFIYSRATKLMYILWPPLST